MTEETQARRGVGKGSQGSAWPGQRCRADPWTSLGRELPVTPGLLMVALGRAPAGGWDGSEMNEVGDTGGPVTAALGEMNGERSGRRWSE